MSQGALRSPSNGIEIIPLAFTCSMLVRSGCFQTGRLAASAQLALSRTLRISHERLLLRRSNHAVTLFGLASSKRRLRPVPHSVHQPSLVHPRVVMLRCRPSAELAKVFFENGADDDRGGVFVSMLQEMRGHIQEVAKNVGVRTSSSTDCKRFAS